jgi:hypothetical protein
MAGTKKYKLAPTHQRVIWKTVRTSRGLRSKQVAIVGTEVHASPSPSRHATSPNIPDAQYEDSPLMMPLGKVHIINILLGRLLLKYLFRHKMTILGSSRRK